MLTATRNNADRSDAAAPAIVSGSAWAFGGEVNPSAFSTDTAAMDAALVTGIRPPGRRMARSFSSTVLLVAVMAGLLACSERTPHLSAPTSAPPATPPAVPEDADAYEIGFETGRDHGYADGFEEGFDEAYDKGLDEGRDEGRSEALECVRQHDTSAAEAADLCE